MEILRYDRSLTRHQPSTQHSDGGMLVVAGTSLFLARINCVISKEKRCLVGFCWSRQNWRRARIASEHIKFYGGLVRTRGRAGLDPGFCTHPSLKHLLLSKMLRKILVSNCGMSKDNFELSSFPVVSQCRVPPGCRAELT